jgi:phosphoglycolate phosphatase
MTKLIIFDLDGTLIDSLADLAASVNHVLRMHGFPEHSLDEYRYFVGNGVIKLLERALPENSRGKELLLCLFEEFIRYYTVHRADFTTPYPGIPALLEELKRRGKLLAVASNKNHFSVEAMTRLYFGHVPFDFVHGHREGVPPKPDPSIAREILHEAGVVPGDTFFVGDSGVDMQTARAAGIRSIGVTWGFRSCEELRENGADFIVETPREILSLVSS